MRTLWIPVLVLLVVPGISRAEEPSASTLRAEIAAIDGRLLEIERTLEGRVAKDARMQRALVECDRLDAIYLGYRSRLRTAQQAANRAHRTYCEQYRLSSVLWPCAARRVLWWFCDLPGAGRLVNWKWYGPYAESFTKARNEFWAKRAAFEAEEQAVAAELAHDTELPSLGLRLFDDYFAFKDAYLKRKAVCDGTVRPYFESRRSLAELRGLQEELARRRAQLVEELASLGGGGPPQAEGDAHLAVVTPKAGALHAVPLQVRMHAAKGLALWVAVIDGAGVLEIGRRYRLVARLGDRSYALYGRARLAEGDAQPTLAFRAVLPARLGPFRVRVEIPALPDLRPVTVEGALVLKEDDGEDLQDALEDLGKAHAPRPGQTPKRAEQRLCQALCDVAIEMMRRDRMKEALGAARRADEILRRHWPESVEWGKMRGRIYYELSWVLAQEAWAQGDVDALETVFLDRAKAQRLRLATVQREGHEANTRVRLGDLRATYRSLAEAIALLGADLERARRHWRTGRALGPPPDGDAPRKAGPDPVWFAP